MFGCFFSFLRMLWHLFAQSRRADASGNHSPTIDNTSWTFKLKWKRTAEDWKSNYMRQESACKSLYSRTKIVCNTQCAIMPQRPTSQINTRCQQNIHVFSCANCRPANLLVSDYGQVHNYYRQFRASRAYEWTAIAKLEIVFLCFSVLFYQNAHHATHAL